MQMIQYMVRLSNLYSFSITALWATIHRCYIRFMCNRRVYLRELDLHSAVNTTHGLGHPLELSK